MGEESASRRHRLSINPDGAFTLGLHVDFGQLSSVVVNLAGGVLHRQDLPLDDLEPERAARAISRIVARLLGATQLPLDRFLGIGLATPGPFAVAGLSPPRLPGWDGVGSARLAARRDGPQCLARQ